MCVGADVARALQQVQDKKKKKTEGREEGRKKQKQRKSFGTESDGLIQGKEGRRKKEGEERRRFLPFLRQDDYCNAEETYLKGQFNHNLSGCMQSTGLTERKERLLSRGQELRCVRTVAMLARQQRVRCMYTGRAQTEVERGP